MRTVSLEMAERLKAAGLRWEPTEGDIFYFNGFDGPEQVICTRYVNAPPSLHFVYGIPLEKMLSNGYPFKNCLWLPTLPDLLDWLEGRECLVQTYQGGSAWCHQAHEDGRYYCLIWRKKDVFWDYAREFTANTREDALAKGVLWVLEQEAKKE